MGQQPRAVLDINVTAGLGGVRSLTLAGGEPAAYGLYRDRDGDIWEKDPRGWRLCLQDGIPVDPDTVWDWTDSVREFAPLILWG
ncbi:hypothetical protein [Nocardia sp. NPDC004722]